jgi:sialic acid synthase SpsE
MLELFAQPETSPCFIIAEAGINHNGDFATALKMIDLAKEAGASAIKFQTYVTEKRVAKDNPVFDILKKCELSFDEQTELKKHADNIGILFFSTPFDTDSVHFLKTIGVSLFKIASFDLVNEQLLSEVVATKLPVIISRGMANTTEIDRALDILQAGQTKFALLHCISSYPAAKEVVNLKAITSLRERYHCIVGYSDHTLDLDASVYSVVLGAKVVEKHFTLDRAMVGPDHAMSVDPEELKLLCQKIREAEVMLGTGVIAESEAEQGAKIFRRPTKIS